MTIERPPVSIENSLHLAIGELSIEHAAEVTGRKLNYLRDLTHPDKRAQLTVRDLELLDQAHHEKHGKGFPLFEALGRRLGTARGERFADAAAIGQHAATIAKEEGEAVSALVEAAMSAARDPKKLRDALRQTEDIHRAAGEALVTIRSAIANLAEPP